MDDAKEAARPWQMRHLNQVVSLPKAWQQRSRLRRAAYERLSTRLEHLLMALKTMSSFSDTEMSVRDLLSFTWELIFLVHKSALGLTRLLHTHNPQLGGG